MSHWYALKSQDELLTASCLREAGFDAFVVCETVERKIRRLKLAFRRPLVRGYVFVHCTDQAFTAVRAIGASSDFLRYTDAAGDRVPLRIPADTLAPIVWAEAFGAFDHTRQPEEWSPGRGDLVVVKSGLWNGYVGVIISVGSRGKALVELRNWKKEFSTSVLELAV